MACCGSRPIKAEHPYVPNYRRQHLTPKFYARHDRVLTSAPKDRVDYYEKEIEKLQRGGIHCGRRKTDLMPRYMNQSYGWSQNKYLMFLDKCDVNYNSSKYLRDQVKEIYAQSLKMVTDESNYCKCKEWLKKQDHWKIV